MKRGGTTNIGEQALQKLESVSNSQQLATMRIGGKLPLASLPEIQAGPSEDHKEIRGDERSGASERTALEKPAGEQNDRRARQRREKAEKPVKAGKGRMKNSEKNAGGVRKEKVGGETATSLLLESRLGM